MSLIVCHDYLMEVLGSVFYLYCCTDSHWSLLLFTWKWVNGCNRYHEIM